MKKSIGIMAIAVLLLITTVSLVGAGEAGPIVPKSPPTPVENIFAPEEIKSYFVEFNSPPAVDGTSLATLRPAFAMMISRPAATWSMSRDKCVFAS